MALSLDQFIEQLVLSGLVSAGDLAEFQAAFPPEKMPKTAEALARQLLREKRLTPCQVAMIWEGRAQLLVLGQYVLLERIGKGGMGEVFKATHRCLNRPAAIKMLRPETQQSIAAVRRFCQEVHTAAQLSHPNIVTTYDACEKAGVQYLVMEYVSGCSLSVALKTRGPFHPLQGLNYALQAARGLEYAHHRHVVHRDIKPSNLLLDDQETIKISDMGLARIIEEESLAVGETFVQRLTASGQLLGSVDYVSPEQAENSRGCDHRSDIYSLGCTLWTILTGTPVYEGDSPAAKLMAHSDYPIPSLRDHFPHIPLLVDQVFQKMVAKRPADRYPSMTEIIEQFQACLDAMKKCSEDDLRLVRRDASTVAVAAATGQYQTAAEGTTVSMPGRKV